jgi:hypothetical protein
MRLLQRDSWFKSVYRKNKKIKLNHNSLQLQYFE